MIYLASPYSHTDPNIMQQRFEAVEAKAAELMKEGVPAYSPIVHGHAMAQKHDLPTDFAFWQNHCISMLKKADSMIVLALDGWDKSIGVMAEIKFCHANAIDVIFVNA